MSETTYVFADVSGNTLLITSIVSEDQGIYLNILHASQRKIPVVKLHTGKGSREMVAKGCEFDPVIKRRVSTICIL